MAIEAFFIPEGQSSVTFYLVPSDAGERTISVTALSALAGPGGPIQFNAVPPAAAVKAHRTFTAKPATPAPVDATLKGPTGGTMHVKSTPFTVTLDQPAPAGGVAVTPVSSVKADVFSIT